MSRLRFKGGVWTNSEDEVLRASLTVYGLQNWERVASMLVRKTAAQCRERWENFLDPRLNIHEAWTAEEEELLVQLQSLFANQWNLIARELRHRIGMNRPAWLCEEHYHSLLDTLEFERQRQADVNNNKNESLKLEDFLAERRRHRCVHQGHETRAARPDAVNSDVFEKEMVEFAVSRLANQDGKKGLRKERKKQLEHTSFLAKLQSNREAIESGTLSSKSKKRMERAMLEDIAGPTGTKLKDNIIEDDDRDSDGNEYVGNDESTGRRRDEFQPIDLGADKQEAGIQAKRRILVKDLSSNNAHLSADIMASENVNVELLRVTSGASTTATRRLLGKKDTLLIASDSNKEKNKKDTKVPSGVLNNTDLDTLFASLPEAEAPKHKSTRHVSVSRDDDLFSAVPAPTSHEEILTHDVFVADGDSDSVASVILDEHSVSTQEEFSPLNFDPIKGNMWIREAKRRVSMEAQRAFFNSKRSSSRQSNFTRTKTTTTMKEEEEKENNKKIKEVHNENKEEFDESTWHLVQALVAQQLPDAAQCLLGEPVTKKMRHSEIYRNNKEEEGEEEEKEKEDEYNVDVRSKLAACVAAAQQENNGEYWKGVGATEATMRLDEILQHQREQLTAMAVDESAEKERAERIVRICFSGRQPHICGDDFMRRACIYWAGQLEDARRELAFYNFIRETEHKEIQQRLDEATRRLADIEHKERLLQERYRSMQIA